MAKSNLRRLYPRKSVTLVCFEGRLYGRDESELHTDVRAHVTKMPSDGGRARVSVVQGPVTETWRSYKA
jgi:hypothetical protein